MVYYPAPPLVGASIPYKFKYTPILLEVVPSVVTADDADLTQQAVSTLKITNPTSRLRGSKQALQKVSRLVIPASGVLRFKLLPSDLYYPSGIYHVAVFSGTNQHPDYTMQWTVPYALNELTFSLVHQDHPAGDYVTDIGIYDLVSVSRGQPTDYVFKDNYLLWLTNAPAVGESYNVTVQPAITLDRLLVTNVKQAP